jgi:hypothetical protein
VGEDVATREALALAVEPEPLQVVPDPHEQVQPAIGLRFWHVPDLAPLAPPERT